MPPDIAPANTLAPPPPPHTIEAPPVPHDPGQPPTGRDVVASFFDINSLGEAIRAQDFNVEEEMELIVRAARDNDPQVSLAALRHFRSLMSSIASQNSVFAHITERHTQETPHGLQERTVSTTRLLTSLSAPIPTSGGPSRSFDPVTHSAPATPSTSRPAADRASANGAPSTPALPSGPTPAAFDSSEDGAEAQGD